MTFDSVEREPEAGGDGFDAKALTATGDAHDEDAFGHDFGIQGVGHVEEFLTLIEP